jgi:hypothetical protein
LELVEKPIDFKVNENDYHTGRYKIDWDESLDGPNKNKESNSISNLDNFNNNQIQSIY